MSKETNPLREEINLTVVWNDDMQSITLTNNKGDTYTSRSEELQDFLHDAALQAQSLPEEPCKHMSITQSYTKNTCDNCGEERSLPEPKGENIAPDWFKAVSLAKNYLNDKSEDASIMKAQVSRLIHVIETLASRQSLQPEGKTLEEEAQEWCAEHIGDPTIHMKYIQLHSAGVIAYTAGAMEYANRNEWISVEYDSPKAGHMVLICEWDTQEMQLVFYDGVRDFYFTHWMYAPNLPTPLGSSPEVTVKKR